MTEAVNTNGFRINLMILEAKTKRNVYDQNLTNNPALRPEVVATRFKQQYLYEHIGRSLLGQENVDADAVSYIVEGSEVGDIGYLTEEGGYPLLDWDYEKRLTDINAYGGMFYITKKERRYAKVNTTDRKITRTTNKMKAFEDTLVWDAFLNAENLNSFDGTKWSDATSGKPFRDIMKAKRLIKDATKSKATDIIMSGIMYERLADYDFVKNNTYYPNSGVIRTGEIPPIAGMNVILEDAIDPNDVGRALVITRGQMGYMADATPLTILAVPGVNIPNPRIDYVYYVEAESEPIIDAGEAMTLITGLLD